MKKKNTSIAIIIDSETKKQIAAVAAPEDITVTVWIRKAIISKLSKQGQESDIKRIDKNVEFLSKLFIQFSKSFGDMSEAQKIILAEEWSERSKTMIETFQIGGLNNE